MPRLFVAVRVPPNDALRALLARLGAIRGVKAVEPENLHYTLRFLGDVSDEMRDRLVAMLSQASVDVRPFDVHVCGTGTFPDSDKPKVVWVGCTDEGGAPLKALADAVDGFAHEVGLGPRDKPFVPHLTLARVKRPDGRGFQEVVRLVRQHGAGDFGRAHVERISLVESKTTPQGPIYTDIAEVRLT